MMLVLMKLGQVSDASKVRFSVSALQGAVDNRLLAKQRFTFLERSRLGQLRHR